MAWTAPRTWVAGEVPTAAIMNAHVRDEFNAIGASWTTYTPALTATATSPSLGTGATALGRYVAAGKLIIAHYRIQFGTSGVVAGSGTYLLSLPVAPSTNWSNRVVGHGVCVDASAPAIGPVVLQVNGVASTIVMQFPATWPGGSTASVSHVNLFPWAASDEIHGSVTYEAA